MVGAVELHGLSKSYGSVHALKDVTLSAPRGCVLGLLGANGAGKTTTIRIACGLLQPDAGRVLLEGEDVTADPARAARHLSVVFGENVAPESSMSPIQYLRHFADLLGMDKPKREASVRRLIEELTLLDVASRPIGQLSGGNRRKVEIARALLPDRPILLLDEPSRELDIPTKEELWDILERQAQQGKTVVLCTHETQEIAGVCDQLAIINQGRISWSGTPAQLHQLGPSVEASLATLIRGPSQAARAR